MLTSPYGVQSARGARFNTTLFFCGMSPVAAGLVITEGEIDKALSIFRESLLEAVGTA